MYKKFKKTYYNNLRIQKPKAFNYLENMSADSQLVAIGDMLVEALPQRPRRPRRIARISPRVTPVVDVARPVWQKRCRGCSADINPAAAKYRRIAVNEECELANLLGDMKF